MPRMKCPACGSRNTARIQYGMPMWDEELQRKLDNKTIILGGCCITPESPDYHCNNCQKEFGDTPYMEELLYFVFTKSSFGLYYSCFFLDCKKKTLRYILTDGIFVDIRKKNIPEILKNEGRYREIQLDDRSFNSLLKSLAKCKIDYWNKDYVDESIMDGLQWGIEMKFEGRKAFKRSGDNMFPPYWNELEKIVEDLNEREKNGVLSDTEKRD